MEGDGVRLFELDGLKSVFHGVRCGECGETGTLRMPMKLSIPQCGNFAQLFMGKTSAEIACTLAVCCFNDGSSSFTAISDRLQLTPSPLKKDLKRLKKSEYSASRWAKKLRRLARRKRKGLDDHHQHWEEVVYATGAFDRGSSKVSKTVEQ